MSDLALILAPYQYTCKKVGHCFTHVAETASTITVLFAKSLDILVKSKHGTPTTKVGDISRYTRSKKLRTGLLAIEKWSTHTPHDRGVRTRSLELGAAAWVRNGLNRWATQHCARFSDAKHLLPAKATCYPGIKSQSTMQTNHKSHGPHKAHAANAVFQPAPYLRDVLPSSHP